MTIANQIEDSMTENRGKIFSIHDFYHLGTKNTVKSALYRLHEENKIVRLIDGLYTKPKYSQVLKEYTYPDASVVAEKLADKFSWTIAPAGETALNYTGLSISPMGLIESIYIGVKRLFLNALPIGI